MFIICGTTHFITLKTLMCEVISLVKFQKQLAYKYKEKKHFKHVVLVSSEAVKKLGWKPGQELKEVVAHQTLIISPKSQETSRKTRKQQQ
jgi:hypothetical protein